MRGDINGANRESTQRQALVKVRIELEAANARLANAGYEVKATRGGGFVARINTALAITAEAIQIIDQTLSLED